jgi:hypothetical protein
MLIQPLSYNTQKLKVGIFYQGGIIVFVDSKNKQGLIAGTEDISPDDTFVSWQLQSYSAVTTTNVYGSGLQNTINIEASATATPAATLCLDYTGGGYGDWFLPNPVEIKYVFDNKQFLTGLSNTLYWTSHSIAFNTAQAYDFSVSSPYTNRIANAPRQYSISTTPYAGYVRPCRYITFT